MPILLHGKKPQNLCTGYVLANCPTAKQAANLADAPPWKILRNDTICQAVEFADGTIMAAFFSPGSCETGAQGDLQVGMPCLVILDRNKLYISDPAHKGGIVEISWNNKVMDIQLPKDGTTIEKVLSEI